MKRKYVKTSCHESYESAVEKAQEMRAEGQTASVRETAGGACVYSAGDRIKRKSRSTGAPVSISSSVSGTREKVAGSQREVLFKIEVSRPGKAS